MAYHAGSESALGQGSENIGVLLMKKGGRTRRFSFLRRAVRLDADDTRLQENLAVALAMTGDVKAGMKVRKRPSVPMRSNLRC